jgi:hypothetical protein
MIHPIVFAQTVSTYPYRIKESKREGDPICDHFNMKVYENRVLVAVADGCSWGRLCTLLRVWWVLCAFSVCAFSVCIGWLLGGVYDGWVCIWGVRGWV